MLAKFKDDFSSIGDSMIKRIQNQIRRGKLQPKNSVPTVKKAGRKPAQQIGRGKTDTKKSAPKATSKNLRNGVTKTVKKSSAKRKLQTNV